MIPYDFIEASSEKPNEATIRAMQEIEAGESIPLELKDGETLHEALIKIAKEQ